MKIFVDENIPIRQPNSQKIHEKIVRAIQHFQEQDWPGIAVVMRDRVMAMWKRKVDEAE